ncbi:MAG: cofactor-independent phosphoglycerate mutase [Parasporobacterium sp.]|nr:cofactor-independent phosphoglycerate mutase [Parasporobacterium sp.]
MKFAIILGDGMADRPIEELNGMTPIEAAETPMMDYLSAHGELGLVATIPEGMKPGSDTANLSVLGYDPKVYYSGRSPLEALSLRVNMLDDDIALRTNIVTVSSEDDMAFADRVITDHSSSEISTEDAAVLLNACREVFENEEFAFYVGTSYRHCCIWHKGEVIDLAQPHDHLGEVIGQYLPENEKFRSMMERSFEILNHHPINEERRAKGLNPANCFWFWGAGTKPKLFSFTEKTGLKGSMISAVDLLKGIGVGTEMNVLEVEGANGQLETNYEGKADAALKTLLEDGNDFVYVHVEAPDEMGHQGSVERKVKSIAYLDQRLIKRIYDGLKASGEDFRLLILPDHETPICIRTHASSPVPYILYDSREMTGSGLPYSEKCGAQTDIMISPGHILADRLINY